MFRPERMLYFSIVVPVEYEDELINALVKVGLVQLNYELRRVRVTMPKVLEEALKGRLRPEDLNMDEALKIVQSRLPSGDELRVKVEELYSEYSRLLQLKYLISELGRRKVHPEFLRHRGLVLFRLFEGEKQAVQNAISEFKAAGMVAEEIPIGEKRYVLTITSLRHEVELYSIASKCNLTEVKLPKWLYTTFEEAEKNIDSKINEVKRRTINYLSLIAHRILREADRILKKVEYREDEIDRLIVKVEDSCKAIREALQALRTNVTKLLCLKKYVQALRREVKVKPLKEVVELNDHVLKGVVGLNEALRKLSLYGVEEYLLKNLYKRVLELKAAIDIGLIGEDIVREFREYVTKLNIASTIMYLMRNNPKKILDKRDLKVINELDRILKGEIEVKESPRINLKLAEEYGRVAIELGRAKDDINSKLNKLLDMLDRGEMAKIVDEVDYIIDDIKRKFENTSKLIALEPYVKAYFRVKNVIKRIRVFRKKGVCITEGWIPERYYEVFKETIKRSIHKIFYFKLSEPSREEKPPTMLRVKGLISRLATLTLSRGIPSYWELDPTPIFIALFTLMYGIMFGDLGLGAIILAFGLFLYVKKKRFLGLTTHEIEVFGAFCIACGVAAIVFGGLYGIAFLKEIAEHAILPRPLHDIADIIKIALIFGVIQLLIGMTMHFANMLYVRDYLAAFFDGTGLVGIIYYSIGVYLAYNIAKSGFDMKVLMSPKLRPYTMTALLMMILVIVGAFLKAKVKGEREELMTGIIELIEMLIAYPANSLSYIRLAAFAMAHEAFGALAIELAKMIPPIASFLFANIIVLAIEGLAVGIQALRLVYYEFATKFFAGEGELFKPLLEKPP